MKALITGASSGIGRDMSIYLSKLGYDVILVSRDVNKLNEVAELLNTNVKVIPMDLSVRENAFKLYDMVKDENIDFLINNAGFGLFGNTWETAEKALKDCRQRPSFPCVSLPDERDTAGSVGHCAARTVRRDKGTHQSHVMMGTKSFGGMDPRHLHLYLLNNILGGPAFGSRLNLSLREKRGLVYTVESNSVCYTDTGVWSVYFGCDTKDVDRCLRLVRKELDRLTCTPLSQRALDAARRQLKGQIGISCDNGENVAMGMAKRFLHYHSTQSMSQLFGRLDDITPGQLLETARCVFAPSHLVTLIYEGTK